jgi:Histidine phosphatase superfamily (branch 1)
MRSVVFGLAALATAAFVTPALADDPALWAALQAGGKVVIMRHADAPGPEQGREGDPPGFQLDDCATQRNLSAFGREQAVKLGDEFRAHGVTFQKVMASPWCRAKDTANLMNLGPVETTPLLRNMGEHEGGAGAVNRGLGGSGPMMRRLHWVIGNWKGPGNLLMVSHGRTVAMLVWNPRTVSPQQGSPIVLEPMPGNKPKPFYEMGSLSGGSR